MTAKRDMKAFHKEALDEIFGRTKPTKKDKTTKGKKVVSEKYITSVDSILEKGFAKKASKHSEAAATIRAILSNAEPSDIILKTPGSLEIMSITKAFKKFPKSHLPKEIKTPHLLSKYLQEQDLTNGNVSMIHPTKLTEDHYEPKTEASFQFPKTKRREPPKNKLIKPAVNALDVDKDNLIKSPNSLKEIIKTGKREQAKIKARSNLIKEVIDKSKNRPNGKNYLKIDRNGKYSYEQPKDIKNDIGISSRAIAPAFKKSPVKEVKGALFISLNTINGGEKALKQELENYIGLNISNNNIHELQNDDTQWDDTKKDIDFTSAAAEPESEPEPETGNDDFIDFM